MKILDAPDLLKFDCVKDKISYIDDLIFNLETFIRNYFKLFDKISRFASNTIRLLETLKGLLVLLQGLLDQPDQLYERNVFNNLALSNILYAEELTDKLMNLINELSNIKLGTVQKSLIGNIRSSFKVFLDPLQNLKIELTVCEKFFKKNCKCSK